MALNSLFCADVPLSNYSLTHSHNSWPVHLDIINPPLLYLAFRKPQWQYKETTDIMCSYRESWMSASFVTTDFVDDSIIRNLALTFLDNSGLC